MGNDIFQKAIELKDYSTKIRRELHQHPELGMKEYKTAELIKKELESFGVEIVPIDMETGVLGVLKGNKKGSPVVTAIRADIDALPIEEINDIPYKSVHKGVMHACGHDGHTAILLGIAKLLSSMKDQFSGIVKFVFQPAEEILTGAKVMVEAGVLENPEVDNIVSLHADPYLDTGKIGTWIGTFHASGDKFNIKITGNGGHGALPHQTNDVVLTASQLVVALQGIVSRQINAFDSTVISVCTIHGGTAFNIIPEEITLTGTVRCHNPKVREEVGAKMEKIIKNISKAFGCNYEFDYIFGVPSTVNHPDTIKELTDAANKALGEGYIVELPTPRMGSEDFSFFMEKVSKSAMLRLGVTAPGNKVMPGHSNRFNFDDDALPYGIAVLAQYVLDKNK